MARPNNTVKDFWNKVCIRSDKECWEWMGNIHKKTGYGQFPYHHKNILSHRFAYESTKGNIPADKQVCHTCDNRKCCNPSHLWLGTQKDNIADMILKNRKAFQYGDLNPASKLTLEQIDRVPEYRASGMSSREIASLFRVSKATINRILQGKERKQII